MKKLILILFILVLYSIMHSVIDSKVLSGYSIGFKHKAKPLKIRKEIKPRKHVFVYQGVKLSCSDSDYLLIKEELKDGSIDFSMEWE